MATKRMKSLTFSLISSSVTIFPESEKQNIIQGVPGEKFNILGGHSIGYSKQKSVYVHVSYSELFRDRAISLYRSKIVDMKLIL
jgi:hypothetical protein